MCVLMAANVLGLDVPSGDCLHLIPECQFTHHGNLIILLYVCMCVCDSAFNSQNFI